MSRIGKKVIELPPKVSVVFTSDGAVKIAGPRGSLQWSLPKSISGKIEGNLVAIVRYSDDRKSKAQHGLTRAVVSNMVKGVSEGFTKSLEIQGVGFKASMNGNALDLSLGFSHPILYPIPEGIKITLADNTKIKVEGIDKQLVGQVASDIRAYYPPEPYKGKGVRYVGEHIVRKEGKTVQ